MPVVISKLSPSHHAAWDNYVSKKPASIYHNSRWARLIKKVFGHNSHYLMATNDGRVVGIFPLIQLKSLLFGNFLVSMPYFNYGGVVAESEAITSSLVNSARDLSNKLGCSHIEMRFSSKQELDLPARTDKIAMLLNLPDDPDVLWQAIGSKRRAQVKRPIREGVEFVCGGLELLEDFYYVFSVNMRDLGTPVYSKNFFREILSTFPDNTFIAVVRLNDEAVGAGFLIGNNGRLEIPWASTLRKVNRIGVNMFLYWNILRTAIDKNFALFDFGRSSKDSGTLKFKKQWGAVEHQLYWYYDLPQGTPLPGLNPKNKKFATAISVWKRLPVGMTNLIGPRVVKNLP